MDGSQVIYVMIGFCLVAIILIVFGRQLKFLIRAVINGAVGAALMFVINIFAGSAAVGINFITLLVAGVLGIPGVVSLYIIQSIL